MKRSPRYERFTFLVNPSERSLIATLAEKLQRTQSDAVRFVVTSAARELQAADNLSCLQGPQPSGEGQRGYTT